MYDTTESMSELDLTPMVTVFKLNHGVEYQVHVDEFETSTPGNNLSEISADSTRRIRQIMMNSKVHEWVNENMCP